jgi:hypothetical protein
VGKTAATQSNPLVLILYSGPSSLLESSQPLGPMAQLYHGGPVINQTLMPNIPMIVMGWVIWEVGMALAIQPLGRINLMHLAIHLVRIIPTGRGGQRGSAADVPADR